MEGSGFVVSLKQYFGHAVVQNSVVLGHLRILAGFLALFGYQCKLGDLKISWGNKLQMWTLNFICINESTYSTKLENVCKLGLRLIFGVYIICFKKMVSTRERLNYKTKHNDKWA